MYIVIHIHRTFTTQRNEAYDTLGTFPDIERHLVSGLHHHHLRLRPAPFSHRRSRRHQEGKERSSRGEGRKGTHRRQGVN